MRQPANLADLLVLRAEQWPGHAYTQVGADGATTRLAWPDLLDRAGRLAHALADRLAPGQRVLLATPPGLAFVEGLFGCLLAGAVAVPAPPPGGSRGRVRLRSMAGDCRPSLALTTTDALPAAQRVAAGCPALAEVAWLAVDDPALAERPARTSVSASAHDVAVLQYTSGSTAEPRGVAITHANLLHNLGAIMQAAGLHAGDVGLSWLPPHHDMGLIGGILLPLYGGGSTLLMSPHHAMQNPAAWLRTISTHRVNVSGGPNFAYQACVDRIGADEAARLDLSCWRVAFCGAEPVQARTLAAFQERFGPCGLPRGALLPTYGLAEATLMVSGRWNAEGPRTVHASAEALAAGRIVPARPDAAARGLVSCGAIAPGLTVQIVHPETLAPQPAGAVGEIWVSGPSVAAGYFQQPEATAAVFGARLADDPQGGPWLRTGDLGALDAGELLVVGRIRDVIIIRGRNVHPQDLEHAVAACDPCLAGCTAIAFGVARDGAEHLVVAIEAPRQLAADELARLAVRVRAALHRDHDVAVHEVLFAQAGRLPRTTSGKLQRGQCRAAYLVDDLAVVARFPLARTQVSEPAVGSPQDDLQQFLAGRLAESLRCRPDDLPADVPLAVLGVDSLAWMEVHAAVRQRYGVDLQADDLAGPLTLAGAADLVRGRMQADLAAAAPPQQPGDLMERVRRFTLAGQARAAGVLPFYRELERNDGPTAVVGGRTVLMLGSNNYLGLTADIRVRHAAAAAARHDGPSFTGSRLLNGSTVLHRELERDLADFLDHEDALVFTTGYQAAAGTVSALLDGGGVLIADRDVHASILDGAALARCRVATFRHNDVADLADRLRQTDGQGPRLVAVDGVYSMLGDVARLDEIVAACAAHGATVLLDDAHGLGVLGPGGRGTAAHFRLRRGTLTCGTFSKSLASVGGFVAGPADVVDYIRFHARPILFSASCPPPALAAARAALTVLRAEPQRVEQLRANVRHWADGLRALGVPVASSEAAIAAWPLPDAATCVRLANELLEAGVFVNVALPPAVPAGTALVRTSVTATHTREQLDQALAAVAEVGARLGLIAPGAASRPAVDARRTAPVSA